MRRQYHVPGVQEVGATNLELPLGVRDDGGVLSAFSRPRIPCYAEAKAEVPNCRLRGPATGYLRPYGHTRCDLCLPAYAESHHAWVTQHAQWHTEELAVGLRRSPQGNDEQQ